MKEYSDITPIADKYTEYKNAKAAVKEAEQLLEENHDDDFRELVKEELKENKEAVERLKGELNLLLVPKDLLQTENWK